MTAEETQAFVDCVAHNDVPIRFAGKLYWCLGPTDLEGEAGFRVRVYEADSETYEATRCLLNYVGPSVEACMRHFLEDRYWEGRSFYEVAAEMSWVDL